MTVSTEHSLKAMGYGLITFMSIIQFGSIANTCTRRQVPCDAIAWCALAFGVVASVVACAILVLFLLKLSFVSMVDTIAAPILLVWLGIGAGFACAAAVNVLSVPTFSALVAFFIITVMTIYNILHLTFGKKGSGKEDAGEEEKKAESNDPEASGGAP